MSDDELSPEQVSEITAYVDIDAPPPDEPTALVLFGTNQAQPAVIAADLYRRGLAPLIIATGGVNLDGLRERGIPLPVVPGALWGGARGRQSAGATGLTVSSLDGGEMLLPALPAHVVGRKGCAGSASVPVRLAWQRHSRVLTHPAAAQHGWPALLRVQTEPAPSARLPAGRGRVQVIALCVPNI